MKKNFFTALFTAAIALLCVIALPRNVQASSASDLSLEGDTSKGKVIIGDVNGDGKVNLKDAILTLQASNGKDIEIDRGAGDVTGDSKVNLKDAILILKRANGNKDPFPGENPVAPNPPASGDDDVLDGEVGVEDSDF